jgi:hypothetical protein
MRRTLGFASLLFAAGSARAEDPSSLDVGRLLGASSAPRLVHPGEASGFGAEWSFEVKGNALLVTLAVRNEGSRSADVQVRRGSGPGAFLTARAGDAVDAEILRPIVSDQQMRQEMMSRMGPMPVYEPVAAGQSTVVGTWRFEYDGKRDLSALVFDATVFAGGQQISVQHRGIGSSAPQS